MNQSLEQISAQQKSVSNRMLLLAIREACNDHSLNASEKQRRFDQADEFQKKVLGEESLDHLSFEECVDIWWKEELSIATHSHQDCIYRLLALFSRNMLMGPFEKEKIELLTRRKRVVSDNSYFEKTVAGQFQAFIRRSCQILKSSQKELGAALETFIGFDLERAISSARYALLKKDWDIAKGALVGGGIGILTSIVAGPVIGGIIGEMAGLSGAAATSYGLALLGGGSLASGGFGMAGGSFLLGVMFSSGKASQEIKKASDLDYVSLCQSMRNLPILLTIGRALKEAGHTDLPSVISSKITQRCREIEDIETSLQRDLVNNSSLAKRLKEVRKSRKIFEEAKELSKLYSWTRGYDLYKKVVN